MTRLTEIGVALTTFGGLFMLLGVMLFFDGALLALGNVCLQFESHIRNSRLGPKATIPFRVDSHHRSPEDLLLLRA